MKRWIWFALLSVAAVICTTTLQSFGDTGIPNSQMKSHTAGRVLFTTTNEGKFAHPCGWFDYEDTVEWQPICEFPAGSDFMYLFAGYIWLGAKVGSDTTVSTGRDGWHCIEEMYPAAIPNGEIVKISSQVGDPDYSPVAVATEELIAIYSDTLADPAYVDPWLKPHNPLGLEVTQHSYAFDSPPLSDVIVLRFSVNNIGEQQLENIWGGGLFDTEIYHFARGSMETITDDISGLYQTLDSYPIAWSADNDGDPEAGEWTEYSPRSVFGVALLDFPGNPEVNFNWYRSWGESEIDWGPAQVERSSEIGLDTIQTPVYDNQQYYTLARSEQDYDQLWAAIDFSDQGWWPPPDSAEYAVDLANGTDTRFIYSFGSVDLAPGDSLTFAFVIALGENFHHNPAAFDSLFDPYAPEEYYSQLDFSDLVAKVEAARTWYDTTFGTQLAVAEIEQLPDQFSLKQNHPNPFNSGTVIEYST